VRYHGGMTFTPVTFTKGAQTTTAKTVVDYWNLRYDGWTEGPQPAAGAVNERLLPADRGFVEDLVEETVAAITGVEPGAPIRATINAQTGTSYTVVLADENKLVTLNNAAAITVTLPRDSTVALPVGARVDFAALGVGLATFVAGTGATVVGTPSLTTRARYSSVSAVKIAANSWLLVGDLA
jgi:hypothetical protein